ncbi:actin-like protein arp8 [Ascosphaera atra]|nr:actin-like protein arp8 [Ascosphaera atra]
MVGKKSGKALLKEEGLERTDNNMELSSWPQVAPINQKNYYTDYLKRDDQMLAYRLQNEENRARIAKKAKDRERVSAMKNELPLPETTSEAAADAAADDADEVPPDAKGSRTVVIHLGSQNLRIGLASDALPKTMPMVIAHKAEENEAEERGGEPRPKRLKVDGGLRVQPEKLFGDEFASEYAGLQTHLKQQMRLNKRRTLPNSKEMVINYNRRTPFETIPEHNDPLRIEYTDVAIRDAPEHIIGEAALKIPDYSTPRYKLHWPIRHGWPNERDYPSKLMLFQDFGHIIEYAIKTQLGLTRKKDWGLYSCVFVIPDLYEKTYVTELLDMLLREFNFARVCFVQEGLAGSFGAGFTTFYFRCYPVSIN